MTREAWVAALLFPAGSLRRSRVAGADVGRGAARAGVRVLPGAHAAGRQGHSGVARAAADRRLIVVTGLAEGGGTFRRGDPAAPRRRRCALLALFGALVVVRMRRVARLSAPAVRLPPAATRDRTRSAPACVLLIAGHAPFRCCCIAAIVARRRCPALAADAVASLAGLAATLAGAWLKFVLVTRAGFNQGFALPHLPVRGVAPLTGRNAHLNSRREGSRWALRPWPKSAARSQPGDHFHFQRAHETMPREHLAALQLARLRATVTQRVRQRARCTARGSTPPASTPTRSRALDDVARLAVHVRSPTCAITTRSACSRGRATALARLHASSGHDGQADRRRLHARPTSTTWAAI